MSFIKYFSGSVHRHFFFHLCIFVVVVFFFYNIIITRTVRYNDYNLYNIIFFHHYNIFFFSNTITDIIVIYTKSVTTQYTARLGQNIFKRIHFRRDGSHWIFNSRYHHYRFTIEARIEFGIDKNVIVSQYLKIETRLSKNRSLIVEFRSFN